MIEGRKIFFVTSSRRDEYPSNGLYVGDVPTHFFEKPFGLPMDALQEDDEVEVEIRVLSRRSVQRKQP